MKILKRVTAFILAFIMLIQEVSYGDIYVLTDNTYNAANHLICYNGKEISYDADGNMLETPIEGELTSLKYDCRNRLTKAGETTYKYDAENIRIQSVSEEKTIEYVTDIIGQLSKVLVEYEYEPASEETINAEPIGTVIYVYGNGLISQESEKGYYTYHYNNLGSTTRITDEFTNNVETFIYGTYGELLKGTTEKTHYLYNGQYGVSTEDNGLYYMRQRYYNPEIKRFINQDVVTGNIENSQSLNRYCYVQGNPVSLIDPFGLFPLSPNSLDHTIFGLLGMLPVVGIVADAIDCGLYIKEGDTANAIMSGISIAPIVGSFAVSKLATKIKKAKKTGNVVQKTTNAIEESATFLSKTADVSKYGDEAIEIVAKGADDALEMAVDATTDIAKGTDLTTEVVRKADLENGITGKFADVVGDASKNDKIWDYSKNFNEELGNFNDGYKIRDVVDEDLYLVQFHSSAEIGKGRSLKYWTTFEEANAISTVDEYMDRMALMSSWGARDNVSIAKIPAGTKVRYAIGTARKQVGATEIRAGGGVQILFEKFSESWILDKKSLF